MRSSSFIASTLAGLLVSMTFASPPTFAADRQIESNSTIPLESGLMPSDGDVFSVQQAEIVSGITGDILVVDLTYGGGCKDHTFRAFWDGSYIKTNPPGITVVLWHDAKNDPCKAIVPRLLHIESDVFSELGYVDLVPAYQKKAIKATR